MANFPIRVLAAATVAIGSFATLPSQAVTQSATSSVLPSGGGAALLDTSDGAMDETG
jgi:hypothetical protein